MNRWAYNAPEAPVIAVTMSINDSIAAMSLQPDKFAKPLGIKAYGSICHLPGSRLGPGDHKLNEGQARILTEKTRDKHDVIIVQEKLDGSNVCVARVSGVLIPLGRAGYPAISSKFEQHKLFAQWVYARLDRFEFLIEGERLCGE